MIRFFTEGSLSPIFKKSHINLTYDFLNHVSISIDDFKKLLNYYCIYDIFDYDLFVYKLMYQYSVDELTYRFDKRVGLPHKYNKDGLLEYEIKKTHEKYVGGIVEVISPNILKCLLTGSLIACKITDGNPTWYSVKCKEIKVSVYIDENGEIYD